MTFQPTPKPMWEGARLARTSETRRERGRLRKQLIDLVDSDAPRSGVEPIRARIQQLNTLIQEQDGQR